MSKRWVVITEPEFIFIARIMMTKGSKGEFRRIVILMVVLINNWLLLICPQVFKFMV